MFWDFRNKIAYIVLQEIDEIWGRAYENQSNNSYFSTSTSNIAVIHILLYLFNKVMFIYTYSYMILTLVEVKQHNLYCEIFFVGRGILTLCVKDSMPVKNTNLWYFQEWSQFHMKSIHVIIPDIDFLKFNIGLRYQL